MRNQGNRCAEAPGELGEKRLFTPSDHWQTVFIDQAMKGDT